MKYIIKILYKNYHDKQVVFLGTIPTNLRMDSHDCILRARLMFASLVEDPNCIYAFQTNEKEE